MHHMQQPQSEQVSHASCCKARLLHSTHIEGHLLQKSKCNNRGS